MVLRSQACSGDQPLLLLLELLLRVVLFDELLLGEVEELVLLWELVVKFEAESVFGVNEIV